jgi:hypothetical protein
VLQVTFAAVLTGEQYSELLDVSTRAPTFAEMSKELEALGQRWGIATQVSRVNAPRRS